MKIEPFLVEKGRPLPTEYLKKLQGSTLSSGLKWLRVDATLQVVTSGDSFSFEVGSRRDLTRLKRMLYAKDIDFVIGPFGFEVENSGQVRVYVVEVNN